MKKALLILLVLSISGYALAQNRGVGFIKALAVPGWQQAAVGKNYGYAMLASELAIIGSVFYLNNESDILMQDSYEYAIKFAHLHPGSYDNKFYNSLSRYESSGFDANGYNAMIRQTALTMYPYDAIAQQQYIDQNSYKDDMFFSWDSPQHRSQYNKLRNRSNDFDDYASVAVGVLILNHLVSGVDYLLFSARDKSKTEVYFGVKNNEPMLFMNYRW